MQGVVCELRVVGLSAVALGKLLFVLRAVSNDNAPSGLNPALLVAGLLICVSVVHGFRCIEISSGQA